MTLIKLVAKLLPLITNKAKNGELIKLAINGKN